MAKDMFCLVRDRNSAHALVEAIKANGFHDDQVSFVLMERSGESAVDRNTGSPVYQSRSSGATTIGGVAGAGIGAAAGWLATIGIAGGSLIAGGPLLAMLAGAAAGGTTGGLIGALTGAGIPQVHVENTRQSLTRGDVIVVAHTHDRNQAQVAERLFAEHGVKILNGETLNISGSA